MDFNQLLDIGITLAVVVGLGALFFFYFNKASAKVEKAVYTGLKYLPSALNFLKRFVKDDEGTFGTYDAMELMARVSDRIKATIEDPTNVSFEDVEEEVFEIVRDELAAYKHLPGVPDLGDSVIRTQVKVVFEGIQRALIEDRTRNDS